MTIVLVLSVLILVIILVLIFGGAEQRKERRKEMKEASKKQRKMKRNSKKESKKYVDIFEDNEETSNIQSGVTGDAKEFSQNEETIKPSELKDILSDDKEEIKLDEVAEEEFKSDKVEEESLWETESDIWQEAKKENDDADLGDMEFNKDLFGDFFSDNDKK